MKGKTAYVVIFLMLAASVMLTADKAQAELSDQVSLVGLDEMVVMEEGFYFTFWNGPATYPLYWSWYLNGAWTPWEEDVNYNFMSEAWVRYNVPGPALLGVRAFHEGAVHETYKTIDIEDDGGYIGLHTVVSPAGWSTWTTSIYFAEPRESWPSEKYLGEFPVSSEEVNIEENIFMTVEHGLGDNEIHVGLVSKSLTGEILEEYVYSGYQGAYIYLRYSGTYLRVIDDEPEPTPTPTPTATATVRPTDEPAPTFTPTPTVTPTVQTTPSVPPISGDSFLYLPLLLDGK